MTKHFKKLEPDDSLTAARVEESARQRRWGKALKDAYIPPLENYLLLQSGADTPAGRHSVILPKMAPAHGSSLRGTTVLKLAGRTFSFAAVATLAVVSAFAAWVQFGEDAFVAEAIEAIRCSEARMILVNGQGPQILPLDASAHCVGTRSHLSVKIEDPEEIMILADLIAGREGQYRIGKSVYGLDLRGVARLIAGRIGVVYILNHVGVNATKGGTAPITSTFESALSFSNSLKGQPVKKIRLIAASMQFARIHLDTDAKRAAFLVNHMPLIQGLGLDPVAGAYAQKLLFAGTEPSLMRGCIFAGAAGYPIRAGRLGNAQLKRWIRVIARAKLCVGQNAQGADEPAASLAAIAAFGFPVLRRSNSLSPAVLNPLFGFQKSVSPKLVGSTLSLTLDAAMQTTLEREIPVMQRTLDQKLAAGYCMRNSGCSNRLDTLVVLAEILPQQLPVRAVYSTRQGLLFGPAKSTENGFEPVADRLGNASLAKLLLLLPVSKAGEQTLCNRTVAGFRNAGGPAAVTTCDPTTGYGFVPVKEALARSMNLPWIHAARLHLEAATQIQNALGYPPAETLDTPAALALGFGRYGSPAAIMTLAAALVNGGRTDGLTLVKDVTARPLDLASLGYSDRDVSQAADWFKATTGLTGTMRAAASRLNIPACTITHGKSGTFFADGRTQAKYGLVIANCGPRRFVIYVGISGKKATDNAGGLRQADLVEFYRAALAAR